MTEMVVIEKNKTNILIGLIDQSFTNCSPTSFIGANPHVSKMIAPTKAIIQYVSSLYFPIWTCGKNRIDAITPANVIEAIMIVAIMMSHNYHPFDFKIQYMLYKV